MKYGILGSGSVGQTIGAKLAGLGHEVMVGTRNPDKLKDWLAATGGKATVGSFAQAAAHGEMVFNATAGSGALAALQAAGAANLDGKVLIDISNPLDFSHGMPPSLSVGNTDSLGEQIQRAFPNLKVVKTLNTTTARVMVDPHLVGDGEHTIFLSGNDAEAKAKVSALLREQFGWKDILDLGDITTARGVEAMLPLWVMLYMKFGTPMLQFKIVR